MFARVAFPTAVPEALSYAVPVQFDAIARPGVRVRARLRGVPRVGLVLERATDPGCAVEKVLPLEDVLDAEPFLPEHTVDLIRFAAEYYAAAPGLVVRTAVPAQLLRLPPPLVELGPRGRELLAGASPAETRLLERLLAARRISQARLVAEGWDRTELQAVLESLSRRHGARVVERRPARNPGGMVSAVTLAELPGEERRRRVGRAPAQQRVTAWLEETGRPALEAEVARTCGCSVGVVGELVKKGVLRRFQQPRQFTPRRWELAPPPVPATLTPAQEEAIASVGASLAAGAFAPTLLLGVTGSGKTEVYLRLAARAAELGLQSIVLVPEIGLTPALAGQLSGRFGERVAVLHSSMADTERFAAWERARRGQVDVVAGPRSSLWAPLPRLGLVVVDEEQDPSYKQAEEPRYHARDLALVLGQRLKIPVLLASATPSLEAVWLSRQGRMAVARLPERVAGGRLPEVEVVDLRDEEPEPGEHGRVWISRRLRSLLGGTLERGEQAILLVNRRGWAPVLLCRECGHQVTCKDCSIAMTVHRRRHALVCHYCGHSRSVPVRCPRCGGEVLEDVGAGTEKVAARVSSLFPAARVAILDRDTARSPAQLLSTLERVAGRDLDVLVGTQMVSKGHHFPGVTLTGVVNTDNLLGFADFRGAERTFQLLTQVAGRAGRGERPGTVVIQTYHPEHHAVQAAVTHDVEGFLETELAYRRAFRYPPVTRLALVRFEAEQERRAMIAAQEAAEALQPQPAGLRMLGPAPAPLARLRGRWRVQLLLLAPSRQPLREALERVTAVETGRGVHRVVDVDPASTV